jgi:carboxymethylenebutenolidase
MPHVERTTSAGVQADAAAAIAWLRSPEGGSFRRVVSVGFCFGGRNSWLAAASGHGLVGAVGFYGRPGPACDGSSGPTQRAGDSECPILALQARADANITAEHNAAYDAALTAAGVEREIVTYPGAPHSFFDRKQDEFAADSEDAWNRTLAFFERHGAGAS